MKEIEIKILLNSYDTIDDLDTDERDLMMKAKELTNTAYAPYSGFYVGAALELENGTIISGTNQENVAYPSGMCAERVAIYAAGAQFPGVGIKKIAITASTKKTSLDYPLAPCGACRQAMSEYESRYGKSIKLIMSGEIGKVYTVSNVQCLLPLVFDEKSLKNS